MKISIINLALLGLFLVAPQSWSGAITNGDFANSCNLSGWNQDTDGAGDIGNVTDFNISSSTPTCSAVVNVGDWNSSPAFFANTLWQELDLTGAHDSTFLLSMNFSVDSFLTSQDFDFFADYLVIALGDGSGNYFNENGALGTLFETDIDGFANVSLDFELDNLFVNQLGWSLEFQMLDGFDSFGSTLSISNVSLVEIAAPITEVPEPSSLALFALGVAGLLKRRKLSDELIRKFQKN